MLPAEHVRLIDTVTIELTTTSILAGHCLSLTSNSRWTVAFWRLDTIFGFRPLIFLSASDGTVNLCRTSAFVFDDKLNRNIDYDAGKKMLAHKKTIRNVWDMLTLSSIETSSGDATKTSLTVTRAQRGRILKSWE